MAEHIEVKSLKTATKGIERATLAILNSRNKIVKADRESHKDENGKFTVNPMTLPRQIRYDSLKIKSVRFVVKNIDKNFYNNQRQKLIEFIYAYVFKVTYSGDSYHISSFKDDTFSIDIPPYLANTKPVDEYITPISIGVINTAIKHLIKDTDYVPVESDPDLNREFVLHLLEHGDVDAVLGLLKDFACQINHSRYKNADSVLKSWRKQVVKRKAKMI